MVACLPVTVVIPVFNEELNLPSCLDALGDSFAQVVIVDSGSTDRTCGIATSSGAEVLQFDWNGKPPKKRNWVLQNYKFKTPWVFFLDADERVTPEFIVEVRKVLPRTEHAGFCISFTNWFLGRPLYYGDVFRKTALFRLGAGEYEVFPEDGWSTLPIEVHEHPILKGSIGALRSRIEHNDFRSLEHYVLKHDEYAAWEAQRFLWLKESGAAEWNQLTGRQRFKYRMLDKPGLGLIYFVGSYFFKMGFLDGRAGFHLACHKWRYFRDIRLKIKQCRKL